MCHTSALALLYIERSGRKPTVRLEITPGSIPTTHRILGSAALQLSSHA